jgi:hypothetical protein
MPHFKSFYPSDFLGAHDLNGLEVRVEIEKVEREVITGSDGKKDEKPVVWFKGKKKRMVLCKTNAKSIAARHGNDTEGWLGKGITIYPTTCMAYGQKVECIRVK